MTDPYSGRLQTKAKHDILRRYLQALAFKVLNFSDLTYVDGFSGPWETKREDFADSSFMIAISVLRDAQKTIFERTRRQPRIRCFLCESNPESFSQLEQAVAAFHRPKESFEIRCYRGEFEDAVPEIQAFIASSFPLIFIDPTGWTGYAFGKITPLFARPKCEVLINFMYEFINRFANSDDPQIVTSLDGILGGSGWRARLDTKLPRGLAVEKLFRETLKHAGGFDYVVSTQIDKGTAERPHFFITYGTKSVEGLKVFRDTEHNALRAHAKNRATAKENKRQEMTSMSDLFADHEASLKEATVAEVVAKEKARASAELLTELSRPLPFSTVVAKLLETYRLRETNIKDICVELAKAGQLENTWGTGNKKPTSETLITRKSRSE